MAEFTISAFHRDNTVFDLRIKYSLREIISNTLRRHNNMCRVFEYSRLDLFSKRPSVSKQQVWRCLPKESYTTESNCTDRILRLDWGGFLECSSSSVFLDSNTGNSRHLFTSIRTSRTVGTLISRQQTDRISVIYAGATL